MDALILQGYTADTRHLKETGRRNLCYIHDSIKDSFFLTTLFWKVHYNVSKGKHVCMFYLSLILSLYLILILYLFLLLLLFYYVISL